jgi:hypothetical protein
VFSLWRVTHALSVTLVTQVRAKTSHIIGMKPAHALLIVVVALSYFALSALIAAPQLFGLTVPS